MYDGSDQSPYFNNSNNLILMSLAETNERAMGTAYVVGKILKFSALSVYKIQSLC